MPTFNIQEILISILVLAVSLSFHEYAHARVAYALGDDTAYLAGRLTMNPLAHLDPIGAICFILARIGWARPVPINPNRMTRLRSRKLSIVLVSLAGPLSNILLAFIAYIGFCTITVISYNQGSSEFLMLWHRIFLIFTTANLSLAVFNMLPVPPLDGYKIFGAILPSEVYYRVMRYERYIGLVFMMLVFVGGGLLSRIMAVLTEPLFWLISTPVNFIFNLFLR